LVHASALNVPRLRLFYSVNRADGGLRTISNNTGPNAMGVKLICNTYGIPCCQSLGEWHCGNCVVDYSHTLIYDQLNGDDTPAYLHTLISPSCLNEVPVAINAWRTIVVFLVVNAAPGSYILYTVNIFRLLHILTQYTCLLNPTWISVLVAASATARLPRVPTRAAKTSVLSSYRIVVRSTSLR
jgi:hypothetical protein